jgi:hypothetical protein
MTLSLIFSASSLILCGFFFIYFRSYIRRKTAAEQLLADYRTEVHRLIAEIDAATDRDSLLVEERIINLRKLLEETDRRLSVYVRELERSRSSEAAYLKAGRSAGLGPAAEARPGKAAIPPNNLPDAPQSVPAKPLDAPPAEPSARAPVPAAQDAPQERAQIAPEKERPLRERIADLAAEGLSPEQIAAELDLSFSEVDLALNLLNRASNAG